MAILPAGFALPPLPYLLGLAVGVAAVAVALRRQAPAVAEATVLALVPWMAAGSALHALYVIDAAPVSVRPLLGAPAVYVSTFVALGAVWAAADRRATDPGTVARWIGLVGAVAFGLAAVAVLVAGGELGLVWPLVGLVVATLVTAIGWLALVRVAPTAAATGRVGVLVLGAHALDGVSTAVGVDVLGFGERTPASRFVLDVAAGLPTAETLGVGWLFVLVKLAVAGAVLVLFVDFLEEEPRQAYLLLAVVAAVGLGPGVHNLLLYAVAG